MTLTEIQARVTKTAAFTGSGIDVSGITGDWTIKLQLENATNSGGTPSVRFVFEDTVNDWTASLAGPSISFKGKIEEQYDKVKSWKKQDFPDLRLGTADAQLRLKLSTAVAGDSIIYRSWLEY